MVIAVPGAAPRPGGRMIRVTVELVSSRGAAHNELLGVGLIGNDGDGTPTIGHYTYTLGKRGTKALQAWRQGAVRDFPRKRLGGWDLLFRVLRDAVGKRNP